ncbi:MAG: XTP/dITP diphosphatase [Candidatus Bathyarchaeota archaeon]|nr:XTP/dITP diphosphatase [Candidatus Termiticorpusculum sp.]
MLKNVNNCSSNAGAYVNVRNVLFATGNFHKFNEVRSILSSIGIAVGMLRMKGKEIQSDNIMEIAENCALEAFNQCRIPLIVEDAGLFIDAFEGFPGPYSAYVYKTIQNRGILKLMENLQNRKATFCSAIVYCSQETGVLFFEGKVEGEITFTERKGDNNSGFGFDPIFQPFYSEKTFAEMTLEEKNYSSHRAKAVNEFAKWYNSDNRHDIF